MSLRISQEYAAFRSKYSYECRVNYVTELSEGDCIEYWNVPRNKSFKARVVSINWFGDEMKLDNGSIIKMTDTCVFKRPTPGKIFNKSCTCGANHTSRQDYHSKWCDANK